MVRGPDKISLLRRRINEVDEAILRLLNDRMRVVEQIGAEKQHRGLPAADPAREREIVAHLRRANAGPLPDEAVEHIYREIISAAKSLEGAAATAYLGPEATFTHLAALKHFGRSQAMFPMKNIREVFRAVEKGESRQGVVPVENSTEGVVNVTLDLLIDSPLAVVDEIYLEVHHLLLSREDDLGKVRVIYSHPQAISQCQEWLQEKAAGVPLVEVPSTAEAARQALASPGAAAIASELAASLYNLRIVARRIEDRFDNLTRFLVIGTEEQGPTGKDKTSVLFSIRDRTGALYHILAPLSEAGVNLTRIESRPSRRKAWDYVFFLDLAGHRADAKLAGALETVRGECTFFKILGSYPDRRGEGRHR